MTGAMGYDDEDERDEAKKRRAENIQNGSILLPFLGVRITIPKSPATMAMVAGATAYEQMVMAKQTFVPSAMNGGIEAFSDMAKEQPYINATYNMARMASRGNIGQFLGNLASGFIPASAMVRSISEVGDPLERASSGYDPRQKSKNWFDQNWWNEQGRGARNALLRGVPVARNYLVNASPGGMKEEERGGVARRLVRQLDPFNTASGTPYTPPQGKVPDNKEWLESEDAKKKTTNEMVDMIKMDKSVGDETGDLEQLLKKKVQNAKKSKTFTDEEAQRVIDVMGEQWLREAVSPVALEQRKAQDKIAKARKAMQPQPSP